MKKLIHFSTFLLLLLLYQGCSDNCAYGGCETGIYLTRKKEIPDTTIRAGTKLELNLKEYFQLGEGRSGGKFAGYPNINPSSIDTSIAKFSYNHNLDQHGELFAINGISSGITQVKLGVSWDGGGDIAYIEVYFTLSVDSE
jgi:hypothetical protein